MVKPSLRTKSIGFKVSEEEYSQLEASAQMSGRTLGEWCREVVLASANGQPPKAGPGAAEALMSELVALRAILLNVLFKLANGEKPTAEDMQRGRVARPLILSKQSRLRVPRSSRLFCEGRVARVQEGFQYLLS